MQLYKIDVKKLLAHFGGPMPAMRLLNQNYIQISRAALYDTLRRGSISMELWMCLYSAAKATGKMIRLEDFLIEDRKTDV